MLTAGALPLYGDLGKERRVTSKARPQSFSGERATVTLLVLAALLILALRPVDAGAAIALRSTASGHNAGGSSLILPAPSGVAAGDVLVATADVTHAATITPPSGWASVRSDLHPSGNQLRQATFVRVATASEPATYTWAFSAAHAAAGGILAYSGVDAVSPVAASSGQPATASTQVVAPSVAPTTAGGVLVAIFGVAATRAITPPSGMAGRVADGAAIAAGEKTSVATADQTLPLAGPTGSRVATVATATDGIGQLVALRPAAPSSGDTTPPSVALTAPAGGATVSGTVTVAATASDNVGVASVQFQLDGAAIGAPDTSSPYALAWNTTTVADGSHYLTAVAKDAAGNATTAARVSLTVANNAPASTIFNTTPLYTTLNHSQYGTYVGATQACDLTGLPGIRSGSDHAISFVSGGATYQGCYSINENVGAPMPPGGKRPAVFVFPPGYPRPASTSAEVNVAGNVPQGIMAQGKQKGWDMIYLGLFKFSGGTYEFTYDQVYADYTRAAIADLIAQHQTDPSRIYSFGTSGGGREPTFMACHISDLFSAVVALGGRIHGPALNGTVATYDRCGRPANPISQMYVYANQAQNPQGSPVENYHVHVTPTHTSLTSADIANIVTLPSPQQNHYAMEHVGEAFAYWNGCANNLVGRTAQNVTVGIAPNTSPNTQLWQWTACGDKRGGTSGDVDLYILPGPHGIEPRVMDDGRAFQFLDDHVG